jgi:hypothetical protein
MCAGTQFVSPCSRFFICLAPQHVKRPCLVKPYRNEDLTNALLSALAPVG